MRRRARRLFPQARVTKPSPFLVGKKSEIAVYLNLAGVKPQQMIIGAKVSMSDVMAGEKPPEKTVLNRSETARPKNGAGEKLPTETAKILAVAAHDLRNPVSAMIALAETLEDQSGAELNPQGRELLTELLRAGETTLRLLENLLDFTYNSPKEFRVSTVDVRDAVQKCIALNRALAARRGVHLSLRSDPRIPMVRGDQWSLVRVINELLWNAIEASSPGQSVQVLLRARGRNIEIAVQDEGVSIPPIEIPRLFTAFPKSEDEYVPGRKRGRHLGLSIVREIVEAHGGQIHVVTRRGGGSTFIVSLPAGAHQSEGTKVRSAS